MHQGKRDGVKGLHLVKIVGEVTKHEYVGKAMGISERFLCRCSKGGSRWHVHQTTSQQ